MKRNIPIKLRAAILLIVFYLNIIVGFACTVGIDMWFNTKHQEKTEISAQEGSHGQDQADIHHKTKGCKDNCCNDHFVKLSGVDKTFPRCFAGIGAIYFNTLGSSFYNIDVLHTSASSANIKYFVLGHHPPIPDIRLAIRSFQI